MNDMVCLICFNNHVFRLEWCLFVMAVEMIFWLNLDTAWGKSNWMLLPNKITWYIPVSSSPTMTSPSVGKRTVPPMVTPMKSHDFVVWSLSMVFGRTETTPSISAGIYKMIGTIKEGDKLNLIKWCMSRLPSDSYPESLLLLFRST